MNIINEYLVSLGFTLNNPTFNQFKQTLQTAEQLVNRASGNMAKSMVSASATIVAAIGAVTIATGGLLNSVAKAPIS